MIGIILSRGCLIVGGFFDCGLYSVSFGLLRITPPHNDFLTAFLIVGGFYSEVALRNEKQKAQTRNFSRADKELFSHTLRPLRVFSKTCRQVKSRASSFGVED